MEEYVHNLHELAEKCDFGAAKDENTRDLSQRLQMLSDLTLEKACRAARQSEQIKEQVSEQQSRAIALCEVTRSCPQGRTAGYAAQQKSGAFKPQRREDHFSSSQQQRSEGTAQGQSTSNTAGVICVLPDEQNATSVVRKATMQ